MHSLLLLVLLQASPPVGPHTVEPLRSGCWPDDQQIATVSANDSIKVEMALAGEEKTCYRVSVLRPPEILTGYVLGEQLPAVAAFVLRRERISQQAAEAQMRPARPQAIPPAASEPAKSGDPLISKQFEDFSGIDTNGQTVHLSGMKGRAILVTFWSPRNVRSLGPLLAEGPLYNQFHDKGLEAVGVSMNPDPGVIKKALDDFTMRWPQVADQSGMAARYGVDPKAGKTFVLDASHRIVAAGPMGPEIVKAVRQLLATPEKSP